MSNSRKSASFGLLLIVILGTLSWAALGAQARPNIRPNLSLGPTHTFSDVLEVEIELGGGTFTSTSCKSDSGGMALSSGTKAGPAVAHEVQFGFESCSVQSGGKELPGCSVRDSTNKVAGFVATRSLEGRFVWLKDNPTTKESEEEAGILLWPEAEGSSPTGKESLMTTEITGASCTVAGTYSFKGTMLGKITSPAVGATAGSLIVEFSGSRPIRPYYEGESSPRTSGSAALRVGEKLVRLSTAEDVSLESKEKFGVFRE